MQSLRQYKSSSQVSGGLCKGGRDALDGKAGKWKKKECSEDADAHNNGDRTHPLVYFPAPGFLQEFFKRCASNSAICSCRER